MALSSSSSTAWEHELTRILGRLLARRESDLFKEPVDWERIGITDYPVVIKQPMDLGTVRKKLESRTEYKKVDECVADIRLVWSNAMLYNAPGSPIYKLAKSLSDFFESQWSMHAREDAERPPTNEEMQQWAENCHKIGQDELGKMLSVLESACPQSLVKRHDVNEVEVNVDLIGGKAFREVSDFVANLLSKKRKQAGM